MAAYTKEQTELVDLIRKLSQERQEKGLGYDEETCYLNLLKDANSQNLCWW